MNILIFVYKRDLKPSGGVAGFCYNIEKERMRRNDEEISFLPEKIIQDTQVNEFKKLIKRTLKEIMPFKEKINESRRGTEIVQYAQNILKESEKQYEMDLSLFDAIQFETTFDLYRAKTSLASYKGIILLQSHSPIVSYKEYINEYVSPRVYKKNKILLDNMEKYDEFAFERADYIIFPCKGAEEPYYHSWPKYKTLREDSKIIYIPTGIIPVKSHENRNAIRDRYKIPRNAFLLSFVGRHNEIKGYDLLQAIFSEMEDVYVICCGKEGRILPPRSERWIEVGWTDDPYSIVNASDVYMLPNRETYFDIAMLQTLSIGKCSVISNTGGNKEFIDTPGVWLYNNIEEAIGKIKIIRSLNQKERSELEKQQQKLFFEKYTIMSFYEKYKQIITELIGTK